MNFHPSLTRSSSFKNPIRRLSKHFARQLRLHATEAPHPIVLTGFPNYHLRRIAYDSKKVIVKFLDLMTPMREKNQPFPEAAPSRRLALLKRPTVRQVGKMVLDACVAALAWTVASSLIRHTPPNLYGVASWVAFSMTLNLAFRYSRQHFRLLGLVDRRRPRPQPGRCGGHPEPPAQHLRLSLPR